MRRSDRLYLQDILDAADALDRFLQGIEYQHLVENEILSSAVIQKFIVMGEASARLSNELKARYPGLPWHQVISLRNIVVHGYFNVDWWIIWNAAKANVPDFASDVRSILEAEYPEDNSA